jgi:para-aminobenzoate synthetase component 1
VSTWDAVAVPRAPRRPDGAVDVLALARGCTDPVLLETAGTAGWHYLAVRSVGRIVDRGAGTELTTASGVEDLGADPFTAMESLGERFGLHPDNRDRVPLDPGAGATPAFTGGLVGAWSYELGRRIERVPSHALDDRGGAAMDLRLVDLVLACPPDGGEPMLLHRPLGQPTPDLAALAGQLVARAKAPGDLKALSPQSASTSLPRHEHARAVRTVLEHIAAGNTFQVNVTGRLSAAFDGDVWELYRRLRLQSPAAYGAVLPDLIDGTAIASVSPETFVSAVGRDVVIRPIKGTRPRWQDAQADAAAALELQASPKDRAENVMVVDMERNDLGRVCVPGSVRVPELLSLEQHPTVWHLVSTVTGTLQDGVGWGELMRATFPCGSVTGAPKVRAMSVIDEVEPVRRGWYCGAVGFVSAGAMSTSVTIRTAVLRPDGTADYGAGGGIVADSDPDQEWWETLDKAAAFLRAVGASAP